MKKYLLLLLSGILLISCVKSNNPQPAPGEDENGEFSQLVKNMVTTTEYTVPVQSGYTTIVTYKGQTLAVTSTPMTILVPKAAVATKSLDGEGLLTYYQEGAISQGFSRLWQTVAFEDSKTGDFDYNDLVFHAKTEVSNGKFTVSVHPIALGSVNPIELCFEWRQGNSSGTTVVVAGNCRQDLFGGKQGFINTFKYDKHYTDFAVIKEISGINSNEPVYINWFINSSAQKIYAVNNFGKGCVDEKGNPFGIVITDTGVMPASQTVGTKAAGDQTWDEAVAKAGFGTFPEINESDYINLPNMDEYQTWGNEANKDRYIRPEESYKGDILSAGNAIYVAGKLTINNNWGNSNTSIYVLDGGTLEFQFSPVQKINTYVYAGGTLTTNQTSLTFGECKLMVTGGLDLTGKNLIIEANSLAWIGDKLNVESLTMKAQGTPRLYSGCCINAGKVTISNNAELYLQSGMKINDLRIESGNDIFIKEGGLIEIEKTYHPTNASCVITSLGDQHSNGYAVLHAGEFIVDDNSGSNFNYTNRFKGNLHLSFDKITDSGREIKPEDLRLAAGVQIADGSTYLPETPCHPSFGGNGDTGASWFRYPKETVHISKCYNFEQWKQGNFDFTVLDENNVFDIYDTHPIEGGEKSIYQMN